MSFNPTQIQPIDLNPSKAIGVNLPFSGNAVFISNYFTKDSIKNNLINFFLTNPKERYMNPNFGGGLKSFIFERITTNNLEFLKEDITNKITNYFPSIIINDLIISGQPDSNTVKIFLKYSISNTNITDTLEIQLQ